MRILRIGIILTIGFGILGIDVGESLRQGAITDGSAHAKRHRRHKSRKRHRKHHRRTPAPAQEM